MPCSSHARRFKFFSPLPSVDICRTSVSVWSHLTFHYKTICQTRESGGPLCVYPLRIIEFTGGRMRDGPRTKFSGIPFFLRVRSLRFLFQQLGMVSTVQAGGAWYVDGSTYSVPCIHEDCIYEVGSGCEPAVRHTYQGLLTDSRKEMSRFGDAEGPRRAGGFVSATAS